MASIIIRYQQISIIEVSPLAPHRVCFAPQNRLLECADCNGLKSDIDAVKNAIKYKFNNGLAEGSVNKIKLMKRIMYGRNSFRLLKAKILLNEYYYQIN